MLWLTAWLLCMGLGDSRCVSGIFSFLRVAHRVSTRCVYAPQSRLWAHWGSRLRVCPGASSEVDLANLLGFSVFFSVSLSLLLRVRRSVFRIALSQWGFSPLGSSWVGADGIRSAALRYVRAPLRVSAWAPSQSWPISGAPLGAFGFRSSCGSGHLGRVSGHLSLWAAVLLSPAALEVRL